MNNQKSKAFSFNFGPSGGTREETKGRTLNTRSYLHKRDHLSMKYSYRNLLICCYSGSWTIPGRNGSNDDVVWRIICREWIFVKTHSTLKITNQQDQLTETTMPGYLAIYWIDLSRGRNVGQCCFKVE